MSSPEVWQSARSIIETALPGLGLTAAWPNEPFETPEPLAPWLIVEVEGDLSEPYELGNGVWQETGRLMLHVMAPTGTGITASLALRKDLANLFRGLPPGPVLYDSAQFDPGGTDEDGNWHRLSVNVAYRYQDR